MTIKMITKDEFPEVKKLKKKFNIFRVIDVKNNNELEAVEFFNEDGVFRGFGKSTKKAFKRAEQTLKSYYK